MIDCVKYLTGSFILELLGSNPIDNKEANENSNI